jgi:digeranylgeranylglycerophospholipid reductase
MPNKYDVIVVGAGPAGCIAAKVAASNGLKTILFEEHPQIGLPEHCMGLVVAPKETPLIKVIETVDKRVIAARIKGRRIYTPNGKAIDKTFGGLDAVVIERNLFDVALAEQAAAAGAEIVINTAVIELVKRGEVVQGVRTNSATLAEVHANVVIAADGIRALLKGIPSWERMTRADQKVSSGIKWQLSGVEDIEPDVLELHLGAFSERGFATIAPIGRKGSCLTDVVSMKEMHKIKSGKWVISDKFRNCTIQRMTGFSHPFPMGVMLPSRIKSGLMLAGDSGGFLGIDAAVSLGTVAGEVAVKANKKGDFSEKGLQEYQDISHEIGMYKFGYAGQFHNLDHFTGHTDAEIQDIFDHGLEI